MVEETKKAEETEKTDTAGVEVTDDIRNGLKERLNFFFSEANLRQDNFMRQFLLRQEGVPVEALMRFNTIKKHTKDAQVLLKVAREMEDLLVVSNDSKSILPKTPFTFDKMQNHIPVTLYVSKIPVSNEKHDVTPAEFKKLFDDLPGLVLVKLCFKQIWPEGDKRRKSKPLKRIAHSAALVEFDTVENMEAAAAKFQTLKDGKEVEPAVKLELKGQTLKVETLADHEKNDEQEDKKSKNEEKNDNKRKDDKEETSTKEEFTFNWKPKCVVKLSGLAASCDREAINDAVGKALDVTGDALKEKKVYTDYSRGQPDGAIRFAEPGDDVDVVAAKLSSGDILVAGEKVKEVTILEGEAEKEYWDKFIAFKNNQLKQRSQERRNKRRKRY